MNTKIRVRFAPSPTGHLHLGGVRTALFNWLYARHRHGAYLLRVEDTDIARSKKEYVESQLASLEWLGLLPDEELVYQMSYQARHKEQLAYLVENGNAYPCFCKPTTSEPKEVDYKALVARKPSCPCREKKWTAEELKQPHALRFKVPKKLERVVFDDLIRGPIIVNRDQLDDFIIRRQDGTPTYNFVVVVDDLEMAITHVIRGEDHISNTPKQILLYEAFGAKLPQFAHLPLILGPSGNRLSKRDAAVSVEEYRQNGFVADALFNYLLRLGWSHGDQEIFSRDEAIKLFTLKAVNKKAAIFDMQKLLWFNSQYIQEMSSERLLKQLDICISGARSTLAALWQPSELQNLVDLYKQRSQTLVELYTALINLAQIPSYDDAAYLVELQTAGMDTILTQLVEKMQDLPDFSSETTSSVIKEFAQKKGLKMVQVAKPLRFALTNSAAGPGVFSLLSILGKPLSIERIKSLCTKMC